MHRAAHLLAPPLLAALLAACDATDRGVVATVTVRDSMGARIFENPAGADLRAPVLEAAGPHLAIGVIEGDDAYQFTHIQGVAQATSGILVVLDVRTQQLRFFDADGRHLRTVGGRGAGPGEFNLAAGPFLMAGDTIVTWDLNLRRLSYFAPNGDFMRTRPEPSMPHPFGVLAPDILVAYGSEGAAISMREAVEEGIRTPTNHYIRVELGDEPGTTQFDTLASLTGSRVYQYPRPGMNPPGGFMAVPFSSRSSHAVGGGRLVLTQGAAKDVVFFDADGRLERVVRVLGEAEPLPPAAYRAEVDRLVARAPETSQPELRRRYAEIPPATTLPAYNALLVDDDGRVWAEHFRTDDDRVFGSRATEPSVFTVFGTDGAVEATVRLPVGFVPHQVRGNRVIGVYRDELDVTYVWVVEVEGLLAGR
jgi:hypothetical protein